MAEKAPVTAEESFAALARIVAEWRERGKQTTTAGLKPALKQSLDGDFDERDLGFTSFREFVVAAEASGHVALHRLETGHVLVLLPGEDPIAFEGANQAGSNKAVQRLKSPIWPIFVEWSDDWVRLWDRSASRAFWYPVSPSGQPAWESDETRFVPIRHASPEIQTGWMREWAQALPSEAAAQVLPTIGDEGKPGEFRSKLVECGLLADWREELRQRVVRLASEWAEENDVAPSALLDSRKPSPLGGGRHERPPATNQPSEPPTASGSNSPLKDRFEVEVRSLVHQAVDRMTLSELLELRLPVQATLERD